MAFEQLATAAEPLVERLWAHEMAAQSLVTPEQRAGLKQRLNEAADTIAQPDIRSQYREEYRRRFDAQFGWQPRQQPPRGGAGGNAGFTNRRGFAGRGGNRPGWLPPVEAGTVALSQQGMTGVFARALLCGLALHPSCLTDCAEVIAGITLDDPGLDAVRHCLIDHAFSGGALEPDAIATILSEKGLQAVVGAIRSDKRLAFSFLRGKADAERARRELTDLVEHVAECASIAGALALADRRVRAELDEASYAEQQRLRVALETAEARLADWVQQTQSEM
jgi:DNA primase